ncbi:MAG: FAD-dependent thymidylate synthase [Anaerolineae bacterium]|nr:FAD-dependent thymidylate synthase [Anaerolineae bacterium]
MKVQLLGYTRLNPALAGRDDLGDVRELLDTPVGTEQERLAEFAARVCYRSTNKMGHNPHFIQARVREGHEDVIEHVTFVVSVSDVANTLEADGPVRWRMANRHLDATQWQDGWVVSGNARVWLDLFRRGLALDVLPLLQPIAPAFYAELADQGEKT